MHVNVTVFSDYVQVVGTAHGAVVPLEIRDAESLGGRYKYRELCALGDGDYELDLKLDDLAVCDDMTHPANKPIAWWQHVLVGLGCLVLAGPLYLWIARLESGAFSGHVRIHWVVGLLWALGGKWAPSAALCGLGAYFFWTAARTRSAQDATVTA